MARVLMVSKPIAPPWNDSSKNLVRDLATHLTRHRATIMTQRARDPQLPGVAAEAVYGAHAGFAPALRDNARALARLLVGPTHALWHFFFAPNPRSSSAAGLAARLRRARTVQTVCSAPRSDVDLARVLFAERTVVLSRHTERLFLDAGVPRARLTRIPPAVAPIEPRTQAQTAALRSRLDLPPDTPLIVYPGDLEFSGAAERMLHAHVEITRSHDALLVIACRRKTPRAASEEARLHALTERLGLGARVRFIGETPSIHDLLAAAHVVALPAENLYAKMDLPLVLIEAMLLERPVLTFEGTPAAELCEGDAALAVGPDPADIASRVARLLSSPQERVALGARARAAALERYRPAVVAAAYETLYDELLR